MHTALSKAGELPFAAALTPHRDLSPSAAEISTQVLYAAQSHSDTGGVPPGRTVGQMAVGGKDSVLPRQIGGARLLDQ